RTLAAGTGDDDVVLWDAATGKHRATLKGHTHIVDSVAYSPDGEILVSGSIDGTVRLWSTDKRDLIMTLTGHSGYVWSVAYAPDGK
ncbi:WD40 repeat domain-containing protein, partial [Methylobacterium crusticola]